MTGAFIRHLAKMTMGEDGCYGTGPTVAACGLKIPDKAFAPYHVPHSNIRLHVTCMKCIVVDDFKRSDPPDLADPASVERWLSS